MPFNRRDFLTFLAVSISAVACDRKPTSPTHSTTPGNLATGLPNLGFQPIKGPLPLATHALTPTQQMEAYRQYEVVDDLVLPEGFTYDVIATWGDKVGDSRFGYNNDYLAFLALDKDQALLTINFEYISAVPWQQTLENVLGKILPLAEVQNAVKEAIKTISGDQVPGLNAYALPENDPLKLKVQEICREALIDQGLGVIGIRKRAVGRWERANSPMERRVTGISGLTDGRYLKATGPAVAVFQKTEGQGYIDQLGDRVIGTFQNCAGGITPWGTVLSAEENFQVHVPEPVYADGTAFAPSHSPFNITDEELTGLGNVFGLAGNKYGWMVEIDPTNPNDYGTKHTGLGRYRHEAVGVRVVPGKPLAFYSGCDRRGGHVYKFVSHGIVHDPQDKANSTLLTKGILYVAQFNSDGTGRWIPLAPNTPVNPQKPTAHVIEMLPLPRRPEGGIFLATTDAQIDAYKQQFKTLGDLYSGNDLEKQGAILIDAHFAANAAGATCTARPEDTEVAADGSLFITFTSGSPSKEDGSPDKQIFKGPTTKAVTEGKGYEFGWIMRLIEINNEPNAQTFTWKMMAWGGEPADSGQGFANPDNLAFDAKGNLWMVTDMSTDKMNRAVPSKRQEKLEPISQSNLRGIFGNNNIWCMPLAGDQAGQPQLFGIGPMDCETTGPCFTPDNHTLFLAVQHPGEFGGIRRDMAFEMRDFALQTTDGQEFIQTRKVPLGSNWPGKQPNDPPKPSVVAIRRNNNQSLLG